MRPLACVVAITAACLVAADALGQGTADKAAAESLFEEGRRLLAEGRTADACPKFAASQKLDPGLGTLLNLGDCYEKLGKSASAWAQFREAASLGAASNDTRRAEVAKKRAGALEPRLVKLTILPPRSPSHALKVLRDGSVVDAPLLGVAIPVDPGIHLVEALAPGKKSWRTEVQVEEGKGTVSTQIPELDDEPVTIAPKPSNSAPVPTAPIVPLDPSEARSAIGWSTQRKFALVAAGAGVVGLTVGSLVALSARSTWKDAQSRCPDGHCTAQADVDLGRDARSSANIATIVGGIGLVGLAAGAVLWLTAPDPRESVASSSVSIAAMAGSEATGLWLQGGF